VKACKTVDYWYEKHINNFIYLSNNRTVDYNAAQYSEWQQGR